MLQLDFGDAKSVDDSLSAVARGMVGSEILKIAADIRQMVRDGKSVCNLTVGDFDARQFPIPTVLLEGIKNALDSGETNYPPSDGVLELRQSIVDYIGREWGVEYPLGSILVTGGARPILYAAYRCVVEPGDKVVYPVPSWNNNHYTWLTGSQGVPVPTDVDNGFMPTLDLLRPHLSDARLLCLCSPLNPTGTVMDEPTLRSICEAVVEENARRTAAGRPHLFLLYDQIYGSLVFGGARTHVPAALVPEVAPWVIALDGASKALAATGLRVGWAMAAPAVTARMKDLIGHVGAWAPRPEQIALARFLADEASVSAYREEMTARVRMRLDGLYEGFSAMADDGYPVRCVSPQGAIYLSLRIDAIGREIAGRKLETNDDIRKLVLDEAGLAIVPFQAFGLEGDTGWFRLSVGACSMEDIAQAFPRLRALLDPLR
ncbi:aminotransferase [Acidobacteria bacterium Mor1]|nr:aminotransferase [Acidobacteria bacterium Mor1]